MRVRVLGLLMLAATGIPPHLFAKDAGIPGVLQRLEAVPQQRTVVQQQRNSLTTTPPESRRLSYVSRVTGPGHAAPGSCQTS